LALESKLAQRQEYFGVARYLQYLASCGSGSEKNR